MNKAKKKKRTPASCRWKYDEFQEYYDTACGEGFTTTVETAEANNIKFCPFCGKRIVYVEESK